MQKPTSALMFSSTIHAESSESLPNHRLRALLIKAKLGNKHARDTILRSYYPLLLKESLKLERRYGKLLGYSRDDIISSMVAKLDNAITKVDLSKLKSPAVQFFVYVVIAVRRSFQQKCRKAVCHKEDKTFCVGLEVRDQETTRAITTTETIAILSLDVLSPRERLVFSLMVGYEGIPLSGQEIGDRLGFTKTTAYNIYKKAQEKVRIECERRLEEMKEVERLCQM